MGKKGVWICVLRRLIRMSGGDGEATPGGSLRFSTESLDDPVQGTILGRSGAVHAEIRMVLPDG